MTKSIIISYRENSEDRKYNLKTLLNWLNYIQDGNTEIIVVEQDSISKIDWLGEVIGNKFIKHIFVKNDGIFNLGWGYNIGAMNSSSNILMFNDADTLIRPITLRTTLQHIDKFDLIKPYKTTFYLDKPNTLNFVKNNFTINPSPLNVPVKPTTITSGCFVMKRESFNKIKGFDEDCYGYGYEDNILDEKITKLGLKVFYLDDTAIHLYHKNHENNTDSYYYFTALNKILFEEYKSMNQDFILDKITKTVTWGQIENGNNVSIRHIKRELYEKVTSDILVSVSNVFTDEYIKGMVDTISSSIYNTIIESVNENVKKVLYDINYDKKKKENILKTILNKFKL